MTTYGAVCVCGRCVNFEQYGDPSGEERPGDFLGTDHERQPSTNQLEEFDPTPVDQWQQADSWPRLAASLRFNDTWNVDITEFQTNLHKAEHKGWCDTELSTNEASIAKLTEDITKLTKAVAELDAAMAKATKHQASSGGEGKKH